MSEFQASSHEILRLAALKELNILDTPAEQDFDDIVALAELISGASISLISLMDAHRQWFKSAKGIEFCEISREDSFCEQMLVNEELLLVEDVTTDDRFKENPFVIGPPYVRFYLGIPIKNQHGFILGSLCVLDSASIKLNQAQIKGLEILARQAQSLFNKKSDLIQSENILSTYVNNTLDSIILLDKGKRIVDCNKVFKERSKILLNKEFQKGESIFEYSHSSIHPLIEKYFSQAISGEEVSTELLIPFKNVENWYKILFIPSKNALNEIIGVVITLTNINDHKNYEKKLQSLNKELNFHYTNSPLAVIKWDSNLTIQSWSGQAEVIFGWKAEEIIEKSLSELNFIHESDLSRVKNYIEQMLSGKVSRLTSKNKNITKLGEVIYCNWHNSILMDENGKVISILSLVENVTDVINITKALEIRTSNYEALINSTDDLVWSIDTDYKLMTMNYAFFQSVKAYLGEELQIGSNVLSDKIQTEMSEHWKKIYNRVFNGESVTIDLPTQSNEYQDFDSNHEVSANPILKNGIIVGAAISLRDVSEKRRTEQLISASEANLQAIFETTDTGYILINKHLEVLSFNKIASDISSQNFFNADRIPQIGTPILDYFPEERKPFLQKMMTEVLEGKRIEYEISISQPDNSVNWYFVRLYPILNKKNQNYGLVMALSDIKKQKNSEQALKVSKERFDLAVKGSSDGIWDWDITSEIIYFSPRFNELIGTSTEEKYLKYSFITFLTENAHPSDLALSLVAIQNHLETKKIFHQELRLKTQDNEYRWFLIRGQATWNDQQQPSRMAGSLTDITERILANEQLKQSEMMFSDLAKNSPGIVFQFCVEPDGSSYFSFISDKGKNTFGFQVNDKNWQINGRINEKERTVFLESINHAIAFRKDWNYEGEVITKDGRRKWFQGLASPTIKGETLIYNGISLDITERKIAEEDRKNLRKLEISLAKEKEINALKSRFISLTSHEFRTPITAIITSADILGIYTNQLPDLSIQQKINTHIQKILFQGNRLNSMLKDILTIEKSAVGKIYSKAQPVDINKFINDLNEQYYLNRKDGRKLNLLLPNQEKEIHTDPSLLSHVVSNLINNAFKYSPEANEPELSINYERNHFVISIKDYGIGIPIEDQEHLFETFFRANNVLSIEGTGLGLTITKEFAQKLGGEIAFKSKTNEGSVFSIILPYTV